MWYRDEFLNYWWNDSIVHISKHAQDELECQKKTIDFIGEILENGKHKLVVKKENKYGVTIRVGKIIWKMIYAMHENKIAVIIISIGERL